MVYNLSLILSYFEDLEFFQFQMSYFFLFKHSYLEYEDGIDTGKCKLRGFSKIYWNQFSILESK